MIGAIIQRYRPTKGQPVPTSYLFSAVFMGSIGFVASAASVLSVVAGVFAIWRLHMVRDLSFGDKRTFFILLVASLSYFIAGAISAALNLGDAESVAQLLERAPFLFLPYIYVFLSYADPRRIVIAISVASSVSLLSLLIYSGVVFVSINNRIELFSGNSNVFGYMVGVVTIAALMGIASTKRKMILASGILVLGAGLALAVLSGSRAGLIGLVGAIVIFGWYCLPRLSRTIKLFVVIAAVLVIALASISFPVGARLADSIRATFTSQTDYAYSDGLRIMMWECGLAGAWDSPLFGAGHDAALDEMRSCGVERFGKTFRYSHFHNVFIDQLAKGGLFSLAAVTLLMFTPLIILAMWRERREICRQSAFGSALLAGLMSYWFIHFLAGLTNLAFGHDAIDGAFIYMTALLLALVFAFTEKERETRSK